MKLMVMNPEALALIKSSRKKEFLADIVAGIGFSGMVGSVVYLFSEGGLTGIYPAIGSTDIFKRSGYYEASYKRCKRWG
jgi:hypothetical protein